MMVKRQRGFTLIEALVALLVLTIGMLGVAAMQLKALQGAHAAYQRSIASLAAQDAQERLWARMAELGDLTCPAAGDVNGDDQGWYGQWSDFLPGLGDSPVGDPTNCEFDVTVSWSESRFADEAEPGFSYIVRLPGE
ncbi:type IV pilus modification protein PilV [Halomonas sp. B23F22_10]|uniref:type IV pilus modification protein PilV n=1 Tax=Halomonas sp. B23F22_10 TaxID=3459515 RepID=UPI00373F6829